MITLVNNKKDDIHIGKYLPFQKTLVKLIPVEYNNHQDYIVVFMTVMDIG